MRYTRQAVLHSLPACSVASLSLVCSGQLPVAYATRFEQPGAWSLAILVHNERCRLHSHIKGDAAIPIGTQQKVNAGYCTLPRPIGQPGFQITSTYYRNANTL
jgi:hypothetical protein